MASPGLSAARRKEKPFGGGHSKCKGPEVDTCLGHQTKADRCTGRQRANVRESSRKLRDPLTHMRHPFLEDGHVESLEQVAMLTFEFLSAFSRGGLGE